MNEHSTADVPDSTREIAAKQETSSKPYVMHTVHSALCWHKWAVSWDRRSLSTIWICQQVKRYAALASGPMWLSCYRKRWKYRKVFQVHSNLCKTGKMNVYVCFLRWIGITNHNFFFLFFFTFSFRFALFVIQASFSTHAGSKRQHWFTEDLIYMYMSLNYQHATAVNNMLNEISGWVNKYA